MKDILESKRYCPVCGSENLAIKDTRKVPVNATRRRWQCAAGHRHTTVEMPLKRPDLRGRNSGITAVDILRAEILADASPEELLGALAIHLGIQNYPGELKQLSSAQTGQRRVT